MLDAWGNPVPYSVGMIYGRVFNRIVQERSDFDDSHKDCRGKGTLPLTSPLPTDGACAYIIGFLETSQAYNQDETATLLGCYDTSILADVLLNKAFEALNSDDVVGAYEKFNDFMVDVNLASQNCPVKVKERF